MEPLSDLVQGISLQENAPCTNSPTIIMEDYFVPPKKEGVEDVFRAVEREIVHHVTISEDVPSPLPITVDVPENPVPTQHLVDDIGLSTRLTINDEDGSMSFQNIEKEEPSKEEKNGAKTAKTKEDERKFSCLQQSVAYETNIFSVICDDEGNIDLDVKFCITNLLYENPVTSEIMMNFLHQNALVGDNLKNLVLGKKINKSSKKLAEFINEGLQSMEEIHRLHKMGADLASLTVEEWRIGGMEFLQKNRSQESYRLIHKKMFLMISKLLEKNLEMISTVRAFVTDNPKEITVFHAFEYLEKLFCATQDLAKKNGAHDENVEPTSLENQQSAESFDGSDPSLFNGLCIFAILAYPAEKVKILHRIAKKKVALN